MTRKARYFSSCTVVRHKLVRHASLNIMTGDYEDNVKAPTWETSPCDTPIFTGDPGRETGVCRGCASGWSVEENHPAEGCTVDHGASLLARIIFPERF